MAEVNRRWWEEPAAPLLRFGDVLGIPVEVWGEREILEHISYEGKDIDRVKAASLTLDHITPLVEAYGDALRCRILLGSLPVLEITADLDEATLGNFKKQIELSPTVDLDFRLDKKRLQFRWLGEVSYSRPFLFLFPKAAERFLTGGIESIESQLWGADAQGEVHKVILILPDHEIWLDGPYLAIIGGEKMASWKDVVPQEPPNSRILSWMHTTCRQNLNWEEAWLRHLTPLHLKVEGEADDGIANALFVHTTNVIILYTADRTQVREDEAWVATYQGANQQATVVLECPTTMLGEGAQEGAQAWMQVLEWVYHDKWAPDRLPLAQVVAAQRLRAAEEPHRYQMLLQNAPEIYEELQWHWKELVEKKIDAFIGQVQALEDTVSNAVRAFSDSVAEMIKALSDTMLAAVAALLGSFIAALFKDEFNPLIFRVGMWVYAAYVLLFPLLYNMLNRWGRYLKLVEDFDQRRSRFVVRLFEQKVEGIVGERVIKSRRSFLLWFWLTVLAYVMVIGLAIASTYVVPDWMATTLGTQ